MSLPLCAGFCAQIEHLVYIYVFPDNKHVLRNEKRLFSVRAIEKEILGIVNSGASSSIWQTGFRKALDARPFLTREAIRYTPGCDGCNRDRTGSCKVYVWVCAVPLSSRKAGGREEG